MLSTSGRIDDQTYLCRGHHDRGRHGRLTECFESAGGNAAAATFIVIDSGKRGQGLGRQLMKFLEDEAERLGYHYVYLWTKTAIPFYQTIGYQECQRVSLKRACLKVLDASQVEHLEASLFRKIELQQQKGRDHSFPGKKCKGASAETILLQPSCDGEDKDAKDVWLRKRLVEHVASIYVSESQRLEEVTAVVSKHSASKSVDAILSWGYFLLSLPWQGQIGPSCGLAALRMVREYYFSQVEVSKVGIESDGQAQLPSLLSEAQERGYTQDGEVFNVNNLMDIADSVCGLDCQMWSTRDLQHAQVWNVLRTGGVFVLPYDSNARTRRPAVLAGKGAHYGIIVGVLVGLPAVTPDAPLETLDRHDRHALDRTEVDTLYLIVQHSLSSQLSIAPWNDFLHSNQQLDIVHQTKFGIQDLDLKNRIICCRGMRSDAF